MTFKDKLMECYTKFQNDMVKMMEEEVAHLVNSGIDEETAAKVIEVQVLDFYKTVQGE